MKRILMLAGFTLAFGLGAGARAALVNLLPMQRGTVVVTCFSNNDWGNLSPKPNGPVVALYNGSAAELAAAGTGLGTYTYPWQFSHNEVAIQAGTPSPTREWAARNLGEVFGIALDDAATPNIYVAATSAYMVATWPAGNGPGTVYKLDGTTGAITPFPQIPNAGAPINSQKLGASLGNLCYHRAGANQWLYVTNLGDGKIYRLNVATTTVDATTFDHGTQALPVAGLSAEPDNPALNYTQSVRRPWGIGVHAGRLYYSVFSGKTPAGAVVEQAEVWSVALDATGNFLPATALREFITPLYVPPYVNGAMFDPNSGAVRLNSPISDIEFSASGSMFVAERYHSGLYAWMSGTHGTRVLEYTGASSSWITTPANPPPNQWQVGVDNSWGRPIANSAGGVAPLCDGSIWASADALHTTVLAYGLQRIKAGGNMADTPPQLLSQLIDLDNDVTNFDKASIGDADAFDICGCFDIVGEPVACPEPGKPFQYTFTLTNKTAQTGYYLWFTPCLPADLTGGAVTTTPNVVSAPPGLWTLPTPLGPNQSTSITVELPGVTGGQKVCFRITMLDLHGDVCCTDKTCVELPPCDCLTVLKKDIRCEETPVGPVYTLTMTVQNNSPYSWGYLGLIPPGAFSPSSFTFGTPVPPGGATTISTQVAGFPGDRLCFDITVHDGNLDHCCSFPCCITLPDCGGVKPDTCDITRIQPCCRSLTAPPGPPKAKITMIVCNNGTIPKTYIVTASGTPATAACPKVLTPASFIPPTQSVTVPPNGCMPVSFEVLCEGFAPGDCAGFKLCAQVEGPAPNTNPLLCCDGSIIAPLAGDPTIEDCRKQQPNVVSTDGDTLLEWVISNPSDHPVDQTLTVTSGIFSPLLFGVPDQTDPPSGVVRVPVSIPPRGTATLQLLARAASPGLGIYPLTFTSSSGHTVLATLAQLAAPLDIVAVSIAPVPEHALRLKLNTPVQRVLKLQRSSDLVNWIDETCTTPPGSGSRLETFIGNGLPMECDVPCDPDEPYMYYRAVDLGPVP
ncbi:MAG: hypothetical protein ACKV19_16810 [Verrucomicrobiales bacterium]